MGQQQRDSIKFAKYNWNLLLRTKHKEASEAKKATIEFDIQHYAHLQDQVLLSEYLVHLTIL